MLRKIRLTLAILFFTLITLLFLDFTGTMHAWFGWMAKIQFLPAVLALNVGVIVLLIALTLVLGRVYCSVICPLGVFQDVISWISGRRKKKKYRFSWSPAKSWLRYSVLALFILALIAGIGSFVALLAPYSSYGRIASNLFAPVYRWGNNLLAYVAERADSYAFYETDVWMKSLPTFIIAVLTFIIIGVLAWRNGRTYCNTICPVGTILGFLSRFSLLRITIDTDKCNACGLCSRKCKAACINGKEHTVDYSRCVACMDCIDTCRHGAISLKPLRPLKPLQTSPEGEASKIETPSSPSGGVEGASRRSFLSATAVLAVTSAIHAQEKKVDGGLAVIEDKKVPKRSLERTRLCPTLHSLPTLCVGMSQWSASPLYRPDETDAARNVLRARLLPSGMYPMQRSLSRRSYPSDNRCRKIVHAHRSRRMDKTELYSADRWRRLWQLCPPLPIGSHTDDSLGQQ